MMLQPLQWEWLHQWASSCLQLVHQENVTHFQNARILMHQPLGGIGGTATDIRIQAENMAAIKKKMAELIAHHTGQSVEKITADSDRDRWFTAEEAKEYGFVDQIAQSEGQVSGNTGKAK